MPFLCHFIDPVLEHLEHGVGAGLFRHRPIILDIEFSYYAVLDQYRKALGSIAHAVMTPVVYETQRLNKGAVAVGQEIERATVAGGHRPGIHGVGIGHRNDRDRIDAGLEDIVALSQIA